MKDEQLAELQEEHRRAQRSFLEASSSTEFVRVCEDLRESCEKLDSANARAQAAEKAYQEACSRVGTGEGRLSTESPSVVVRRARLAAQGTPTLLDLRHVLFPGNTERERVDSSLSSLGDEKERTAHQLAVARDEQLILVDRFTEQLEHVKSCALAYIRARHQLEAREANLPSGAVEANEENAQVLREISQLPALAGLEEFFVPC